MENDSNQKKKSRSIKTSECQEKFVGYHTILKKNKKLQPPEILAVVKANVKWKKQIINITIILG